MVLKLKRILQHTSNYISTKIKIYNNISINVKLLSIIIVEIICIIIAGIVYSNISSKQAMLETLQTDNIQSNLHVAAAIKILDDVDALNFNVVSKANNKNISKIVDPKMTKTKNGYTLTGKIKLKNVSNLYTSNKEVQVIFKFDKNKRLRSGKIDLNDSLDDKIVELISKNITNNNENLDKNNVNAFITCKSTSYISFSKLTGTITNDVFNEKLIEQLNVITTSNSFDTALLQVKVKDSTYVLDKSSISEAKESDTVLKKDGVIFYLKNKVVYGIAGKITDVSINNIKSLEDLKSSLGDPTSSINSTLYWEIKNIDKSLYITYYKDYIEIMYK